MIGNLNMRGLALAGALAVVVAACGGASSSPAPAGSSGASQAPSSQGGGSATQAASSQASSGGGDAIAALADLSSYKVKITLGSKGVSTGMAALGDLTMEGTVILKPEKASDLTVMGIRTVEVGGKTYIDMGAGLTETESSGSSMADSLSPDKLMGGMGSYISQMKAVGDEQKNGMATTHYQADDKVLGEAASALSMLGLVNAKWNWDVWIAKQGGYAVSYALKGTTTDGASFSMSLDISDVNSPSNVVKGP